MGQLWGLLAVWPAFRPGGAGQVSAGAGAHLAKGAETGSGQGLKREPTTVAFCDAFPGLLRYEPSLCPPQGLRQ